MHAHTVSQTEIASPRANHRRQRHRPQLTTSEFLQLGLYRVAYLTRVADDDGMVNVVIHGADGMAIAAVETASLGAELAEQLGLTLIAVH